MNRPSEEGAPRTACFLAIWDLGIAFTCRQGVVSALFLLVHVHMDDALVSWAFALECVAVALKAWVLVEERRDGRLVLGRKVRVPTRVILNLTPQFGSGQAMMSSVPIQSASCRGTLLRV